MRGWTITHYRVEWRLNDLPTREMYVFLWGSEISNERAGRGCRYVASVAVLRRIRISLVFPGKIDPNRPVDLRTPWETALKAAAIEDFRFHDLRHSAASYLAMNGASLAEIAEVLGHKTLAMVKRYSRLSEAHTAGVVARMNERVFGDGNADAG